MRPVTEEERKRAVERSRRMYQTDMQSNLATAEDRGIQIGKQKRNIEIAKNLIRMGLSLQQITEATSLPPEEVNRLYKEI